MHKLAVVVVLASGGLAYAEDIKHSVAFGTPTVVIGTADPAALAVVMKTASAKLLACYNEEAAEGTATATFKLAIDGKVSSVTVTGMAASEAAPVHNCIAAAISKLKFAKPKHGEVVEISYPITFTPGKARDDDDVYGALRGSEAGELSGGFGGVSGGGWGTIGTGKYGTIGHASGYGVGGTQRVSIGLPTAKGDLDKAIIRRYVKRNIQKIQDCYEKELLASPTLAGTITTQFTIGTSGLVTTSTATGLNGNVVETCVATVIKNIEFPKPKTGEVAVTYPLTFMPLPPTPKAKPAPKAKAKAPTK